jgi:cation diffusion facilitator CzcD-associated flavoprotein CzcO
VSGTSGVSGTEPGDERGEGRGRGARISSDFPVVVVGTGFSGIAMGVLLRRAGFEDFVLLEKADAIGGTWRDNHYPGAACDVPSHLYSFSFEPRADWSRTFSGHAEIRAYMDHCVAKYDLARHVRFRHEVTGATFDPHRGEWTVQLQGREPLRARALVLGNGALSTPQLPAIEGLETFDGPSFHSARWRHDVPLEGKRVAVVGTGASAIQFVPEIQPRCGALTVFQRTPPWILPKDDRAFSALEKLAFARLPALEKAYRAWTYATLEARAVGFVVDPRLMRGVEWFARRNLAREVRDPELCARLTPTYTMGCKRILLSNDWYRALVRPNVRVEGARIARVSPRGVVTADGREHPADVLVLGTGFAASNYLAALDVRGLEGRGLHEAVRDGASSYLGISVHGFPNLFLLMGPNTGLGHNSMIVMIEAQARYAVQAIAALRDRGLVTVDVREGAQRAFTEEIQARLAKSVWATGCSSWYLADGKNGTTWPGFTLEYLWRTRRFDRSRYDVVAGAPRVAPPPWSSHADRPSLLSSLPESSHAHARS